MSSSPGGPTFLERARMFWSLLFLRTELAFVSIRAHSYSFSGGNYLRSVQSCKPPEVMAACNQRLNSAIPDEPGMEPSPSTVLHRIEYGGGV